MNFHFLADALQIFVVTRDRATLNDLADTRRLYHRFGDANFVDIGRTLYARRNIHVLSEVIDPVNARHCTSLRSYGIELDPAYVDTTVRRWQALTGGSARHAVSGRSFDDLAREMEAGNAVSAAA